MKFTLGVLVAGLLVTSAVARADQVADSGRAYSLTFEYGKFDPVLNSNLSGQDPNDGVGFSIDYRFKPNFAVGFDFEFYSQDAQTTPGLGSPAWGSVDDAMHLSTMAFTVQGLYSIPLGPSRLHLGAGVGLYRSKLEITGSVFGIPGHFVDDDDIDLGGHVLARWDLRLGKTWWIGLEHRQIAASADFGQWSNGSVNVGGQLNLLSLRKEVGGPTR